MDKLIKVEQMPHIKPEHHAIRLQLREVDFPDFPIKLPAWITTSVEADSLQLRFDDSDQGIPLNSKDILEVRLFESGRRGLTATIKYRDPYEVVPAFNIYVGSTEMYWILAFGKMVADKLGVSVSDVSDEQGY